VGFVEVGLNRISIVFFQRLGTQRDWNLVVVALLKEALEVMTTQRMLQNTFDDIT